MVTPYATDVFGANIVSNTYENGQGVITCDGDVVTIGRDTFIRCSSLASVYCKPTTPPRGGNGMFYSNASGRKIYVPTESVDAYKAAEWWSDYTSDIEPCEF